MKQTKRILSLILCLLMLVAVVPVMEDSAICCRKDSFDKSRYTLTGDMAYDVAMIAKSQKGRTCTDFGYSGVDYGAWCDEFVADCIENAGGDDSIVAHGGTVADFEKKMRERGAVEVSSPKAGDLVFFTWSHVEIITKVENGVPYCAGGNNGTSPGSCKGERKVSSVGSYRVYLRPNYQNTSAQTWVDLGDDFYASILKCDGWKTVGFSNENDNVQIVPALGKASEYWHFVKDADGSYSIINCSNNQVLEVFNSGTENGTNVLVRPDWNGASQRWYITGRWNGEYYLHPKNSDKVLDVDASYGTNVHIWEKNDTASQKFSIYLQPKAGVSTLSVLIEDGRAVLSWTKAANADTYNIRIKKQDSGELIDYWNETSTTKTINLKNGSYVAYIDSCNSYSYEKSNEVSFTIDHRHSHSSSITTSATCSATGIKTYTCSCGDTYTETIPINPSNHVNTTNTAATASTCTVKGYTAGVYCNDCKKYISGHTEQPLAAHTLTTQNAKAATCTAEGYTGDQVCAVCKQTITKGTAIAKKSHSLTMVNKAEASCTTAGYTGDQVCTTCKQTITKGKAVNALGHADADSNGNCTRCGTHIKDVTPSQPSNPQPNPNACKYCGKVHTGPFGWLIKFFHSILAIFKR